MRSNAGKMRRLIVAAVILAVIVVMALRGCPRAGRRAESDSRRNQSTLSSLSRDTKALNHAADKCYD
jgi:hypothetical protein